MYTFSGVTSHLAMSDHIRTDFSTQNRETLRRNEAAVGDGRFPSCFTTTCCVIQPFSTWVNTKGSPRKTVGDIARATRKFPTDRRQESYSNMITITQQPEYNMDKFNIDTAVTLTRKLW